MSQNRLDIVNAVAVRTHKDEDRGQALQRAFSILLFSVFVLVDLLALVVGASSYGSLTRMQATNDARIMTLGPITSVVRANDGAGAVSAGEGPEGKSLVLTSSDAEGTYEIRIYLYEGNIVEEYALADAPYAPQKATVLAQSSTFDFSYEGGILTVVTESGTAKTALRSQQGGA